MPVKILILTQTYIGIMCKRRFFSFLIFFDKDFTGFFRFKIQTQAIFILSGNLISLKRDGFPIFIGKINIDYSGFSKDLIDLFLRNHYRFSFPFQVNRVFKF